MTAEHSAARAAIESNARAASANPRQVLTTRLAKLDLKTIESIIKKDETTCCKVRSGARPCTLEQFVLLLEACNLKLVDRDRHCVDTKTFEWMTDIVSRAMANKEVAQSLIWEDD